MDAKGSKQPLSQRSVHYVMKHKKEMPRTSLRYAIEKLAPEQRKEVMKREPKS